MTSGPKALPPRRVYSCRVGTSPAAGGRWIAKLLRRFTGWTVVNPSGCLEFVGVELPILTHLHIAGHFSRWTQSSAVLRRRPPPLRCTVASQLSIVGLHRCSVSLRPILCFVLPSLLLFGRRWRTLPATIPALFHSLHCHLLPSGLGSLLCRTGWSSEWFLSALFTRVYPCAGRRFSVRRLQRGSFSTVGQSVRTGIALRVVRAVADFSAESDSSVCPFTACSSSLLCVSFTALVSFTA